MQALCNKLSYKMWTTKVNMYHPVYAPHFFCAPQFVCVCYDSQLEHAAIIHFPSNHHLIPLMASKAIFKVEKWKRGNKEGTPLHHHHCPFMLALGIVLVPASPVHLSPQLYDPESHLSLFPSISPQRYMGITFVIYIFIIPLINKKFSIPSKITPNLFHDFKVFHNLMLLTR